MKYEEYQLEDFLLDDYFIKWVRNPDPHSNLFWESWIAQHPEKNTLIEEAKVIISSIQFEDALLGKEEVDELWKNLDTERPDATVTIRPYHSKPHKFIPWQRMAAVLGGLIFLAAFYFLLSDIGFESMELYSTAYGQTQTINLPDGSEVIINANSELKYPTDWYTDSIRQVWLNGEAFFSVKHQENDQKFIVHSGAVDIEVLGTEFNVNHRRQKTQVVLNTGKVKLQNKSGNNEEDILMKPGELVEIESDRSGYIKKEVNTELYTSWRENKLVFDGASVAEIAQLIEDNYGYKITIEDSALASKKFKGTAPADEIENLLSQMGKVFNAEIEYRGKQITMKLNSK